MITDNRFKDYSQISVQNLPIELGELHDDHEKESYKQRSTDSWLRKGHPLGRNASIHWKLGALLLGDGHIAGTPNEGLQQNEGLKFFHQFVTLLTTKAESKDDSFQFLQGHISKLKEFSKHISKAENYANTIQEIANSGRDASEADRSLLLDRYAGTFLCDFKREGEGWFPAGWTTKKEGSHALLVHIDMGGKITLVNTGAGTENHPLISISSQDPLTNELREEVKIQQFITYEGISREKLDCIEFFRFFLELQVRPCWEGLTDFSEDNIYRPLRHYLSVKERRGLNPFNHPKAYKKPQKSGTCAIKSISTALYYTLTDSLTEGENKEEKGVQCYKKIKYLWQTQALVELALQIGPTSTEAQKHFMVDFIENICRSAEKLHRQGLLEERDLLELNCTVEDIKRSLDSSLRVQEEHLTLSAAEPEVAIQAQRAPFYLKEREVEIQEKSALTPAPQDKPRERNRNEEAVKTLYEELPRIYGIENPREKIEEMIRLFNRIDSDLLNKYSRISTLEEKGTLAHFLLEVQASFISTLPIPVRGEPSVWTQMPSSEVVRTMETICHLGELLTTLQNLYKERAIIVEPVKLKSEKKEGEILSSPEFADCVLTDIEKMSKEDLSHALTVHREKKARQSHTADFTVMCYTLLAINDQLARTLPETKLEGFEINSHDLFMEMKSPHFILKTPQLQNTLERVAKYFNPNFSLEALALKEDLKVIREKYNLLFAYKDFLRFYPENILDTGLLKLDAKNIKSFTTTRYYLQFLEEIKTNPTKLELLRAHTAHSKSPLTPQSSELAHLTHLMESTTTEVSLIPKSVKLLQKTALNCLRSHYPNRCYLDSGFVLGSDHEIRVESCGRHENNYYMIYIRNIDTRTRKDENIQDQYLERAFYSDIDTFSAVDWQRELSRENEIIFNQRTHYDQPLDLSREIEMIAVDPYDEVARAFSFLKNQLHLLKKQEIQNLIEAAFFKFGRLNSQLSDNPKIADEVLKAIYDALSHYKQLEDLGTCLYLAKLGQEFFTYARGFGIEVYDRNFRSIIHNEITPLVSDNPSAKIRCLETVINFYRTVRPEDLDTPLSREELLYDLVSLWTMKANNQEIKESSNLRIIELKLTPLIENSLLDSDFRNRNLNRLVKQFYPDATDLLWEGTFPLFENERYSYNILDWVLFDKQQKQQLTYLPKKIYQDAQFKKIFSGKIITCEKFENDGRTVYRVNTGLENNLIVTVGFSKLKFHRLIDGVEYQLIEAPTRLQTELPRFVNDSSQCWACGGSNPHTIVFNDSGKPLLHIELRQNKTLGDEIANVYRYDELGEINHTLTWIPFEQIPQSILYLQNLEKDHGYLECWSDGTGNTENPHIQKIELPRLNLSFKLKNHEGRRLLFCQEHPGYYLLENPKVPSLAKMENFITLENRAGKRKLLLPRVQLTVSFNNTPFDRAVKQETSPPYSLLEYTLNTAELKSNKIEAKLYTLYHTLALRDFNKAIREIQALNPLTRFSNIPEEDTQEKMILGWIFELLAEDKHPSAKAIYLKLAVKVIQNDLKYPRSINSAPEKEIFGAAQLLDQLSCYANNSSNVTTAKLSEKEEMVLINFIQKSDDKEIKSNLEHFYRERRKEYRNYLDTGSARIGTRKITTVENRKKKKKKDQESLRELFEIFSDRTPPPELHHLIQDDEFFTDHFFHLYQIAQKGSEDDKKRLKDILDFNIPEKKEYHSTLQSVLKTPSSYPSIEELAKAKREDDDDWNNRNIYADRLGRLIKKITPSLLSHLWDTIKKISQLILNQLFGKFSLSPHLHKVLPSLFYSTYRKDKAKENGKVKTHIECDSTSLSQTDKAFDDYFQSLLAKYFTVEEHPIEVELHQLQEEHPNIHVAKKLKAENEDLVYHRAQMGTTKKIYSQKEGMVLKKLIEELHEAATNLEGRLKTQKNALLWFLNDIPEQIKERSLKQLHKTGFHHEITWEDLQKITLKGDFETFIKRTHLTQQDAKKAMYAISDYLIKASRLDQMKSVIAAAGKLETIHQTEKHKTYLQYVPKALELVRAYQPSSLNIEKQWFEAANHYLIRQEQLEKISAFIKPAYRHIQGEAPTGFGKTESVIPNLDYTRAAEGKLVFNTWPASLEIQNATNNKRQMEQSFGRKVDRFYFDRVTTLSVDSLRHTYEEMLHDKTEGQPINMRSESLRSLELHLLILLKDVNEVKADSSKLKEQIDYLLKILHLVRTEGWVSIDEEHVNLDPMDKLIYTVGDFIILPKKQIDVFETLFEVLTADESGRKLLEENRQHLLPENAFKNEIAPKLAETFCKKLKVSDAHKESYQAFVFGTKGEIPLWLQSHPEKESIALVKGLLTQILSSSLRGAVDEAFGLSKLHLKKKEFAIPYAFANTPKETKENPSQFKNPHETLTKTYLTYLYKGLAREQLNKLIDFLQVQAKKELDNGFPLESTEAHEFFCKIAPSCQKSLITLRESDIEALYPELYKHRDVIFYYIRNIVIPELRIYLQSLISTVHDFRSQFASSLSLSATPQDKEAHGLDTHFVPMRGTSGQVTHLLLTKCKDPATLHPMRGVKPKELLTEAFNIMEQNPRIHAPIDIEANFKGLSNREVAEEMRLRAKERGEIQAILFFDENQALFKMMDVATGNIHDAIDSQIKPEETQTYYDQSRCFGSDIKQAIDAIGLLMTGKNTSKAKAGQGAGRMRLWHNAQSVDVSYPEHLTNEIFSDGQPCIEKLITYWLVNQVKGAELKNYQSQLGLMNTEIRRALLDRMIGVSISDKPESIPGGPTVKQTISCFNQWKSHFFTEESCDPWVMYAAIPEEKESIEVLKDHQTKCLKKAREMPSLSREEKAYITNRLDQYSRCWDELVLPEKVSTHPCDLGIECEVLQEVEVETQVEIEAKVFEELQKRAPLAWPKELDLFSKGWDKPEKINGIKRRVANAIKIALPLIDQLTQEILKKIDNLSIQLDLINNYRSSFLIGSIIGSIIGRTIGKCFDIKSATWRTEKIAIAFLGLTGAGLLMTSGTRKIMKQLSPPNSTVALFRVNDLIRFELPAFGEIAIELFTPNLLVTNNFFQEEPADLLERRQTPLNLEQKPIFSLIVIMDENSDGRKDVKAVIIDQNDSIYFRRKLQEDHLTTDELIAEGRKRQIGLYSISNEMFTLQGKNRFEESDLQNPELTKLIAQAKFLNGEIKYSEKEMDYLGPALERTAKKVGYGPLQNLFERIVEFHPMNRKLLFNKRNLLPIAKALGFSNDISP